MDDYDADIKCELIEDSVKIFPIEETNESLTDDGWSDEVVDILEPSIEEIEELHYELKNTVRGANTNAKTVGQLVDHCEQLMAKFDDAIDKLDHESDELNEDLIQSDSEDAFKKNVATEIEAGKPQKQALAIAYSIQKKNKKKKKTNEGFSDIESDFENAKKIWAGFGFKYTDLPSAVDYYNRKSPNAEPSTFYAKPLYNNEAWDEMRELVAEWEENDMNESCNKKKVREGLLFRDTGAGLADKGYLFTLQELGKIYDDCIKAKDPVVMEYKNFSDWMNDNVNNGYLEIVDERAFDESLKESADDNRYERIDHKMVYDSDGFTTDYTLYFDHDENNYFTVFGDSDLYGPKDSEHDWDFGPNEDEAHEWFEDYEGFVDDDWDDVAWHDTADQEQTDQPDYIPELTYESLKESVDVPMKRYSDAVPKEKRKYWYFTTHGVQPGSIPGDVNILDTKEGQNKKGTKGTFVLLDAILNTSELKQYDMIELVPDDVDESLNEADESQTYRGYKIVFHPGYSVWTNMKNYYKVYAPQGHLVGGKATLEKAKEMIDNRIANKNESFKESIDTSLNDNVKSWYLKAYPTDELGQEIDNKVTFNDVIQILNGGGEIYDVLTEDSIVRERVFDELSERLGVGYDVIYYTWLYPDDHQITVNESMSVISDIPNWFVSLYQEAKEKYGNDRARQLRYITIHSDDHANTVKWLNRLRASDSKHIVWDRENLSGKRESCKESKNEDKFEGTPKEYVHADRDLFLKKLQQRGHRKPIVSTEKRPLTSVKDESCKVSEGQYASTREKYLDQLTNSIWNLIPKNPQDDKGEFDWVMEHILSDHNDMPEEKEDLKKILSKHTLKTIIHFAMLLENKFGYPFIWDDESERYGIKESINEAHPSAQYGSALNPQKKFYCEWEDDETGWKWTTVRAENEECAERILRNHGITGKIKEISEIKPSVKESKDGKELYKLIIKTNGNPSVKDLVAIGYSEGDATDMISRMANRNADVLVKTAKKMLGESKGRGMIDVLGGLKESNDIPTIEDMFKSVGVKVVFDDNGYLTDEAYNKYGVVAKKYFNGNEDVLDKLCSEENCFAKSINESLSFHIYDEDFQQKLKNELQGKLQYHYNKLGYTQREIEDYIMPVYKTEFKKGYGDDGSDALFIWVGAEVDYDELEELAQILNKVIRKYDKDAYFEPETTGRLVAVLWE